MRHAQLKLERLVNLYLSLGTFVKFKKAAAAASAAFYKLFKLIRGNRLLLLIVLSV